MHKLKPALRTEELLLLDLCRISLKDEQKVRIGELLTKAGDWDYLLNLANEHGIVSLVYYNLEQAGLLSRVPENAGKTLQSSNLKSLARNTFLIEKYIELENVLSATGIKPIVLKGMALEPSVYGNKGLRQMTDIDLYIHGKDQCLKAWKHLVNSGYESKPLKSPLYKKILTDFGKHMPDLYKDGISIDLHHGLFNNNIHIETTKVSTAKLDLAIPENDIHFLFLVKHLADHETKGESQLRLYLDLAQLMLMPGKKMRAKHLVALAKELDMEDILTEKLFLLNLFWEVPVEEEILGKISPDRKTKVTGAFIEFLRNPKGNTGRNRGEGYRKTLRNIPTMRKKLIFILGDLFPSISFMQNRYKTRTRAGACFYYPLRFGKLLLLIKR